MEIRRTRPTSNQWARDSWFVFIIILLFALGAQAQAPIKKDSLKDGRMVIELSKNIKPATLDSFMAQFDLTDLPIKNFCKLTRRNCGHHRVGV